MHDTAIWLLGCTYQQRLTFDSQSKTKRPKSWSSMLVPRPFLGPGCEANCELERRQGSPPEKLLCSSTYLHYDALNTVRMSLSYNSYCLKKHSKHTYLYAAYLSSAVNMIKKRLCPILPGQDDIDYVISPPRPSRFFSVQHWRTGNGLETRLISYSIYR